MFNIDYVNLFAGIPKELVVFVVSMIPIGELRASIPLGIGLLEMNPFLTFLLAVIGNMVPVVFILLFLEYVSEWLSKHFDFMDRFFKKLFAHTHDKYYERMELWGDIALIAFVAIPLPFTGAWTGALVAFLFGIPLKRALFFIGIGVTIAGIIVTLASLGFVSLIF